MIVQTTKQHSAKHLITQLLLDMRAFVMSNDDTSKLKNVAAKLKILALQYPSLLSKSDQEIIQQILAELQQDSFATLLLLKQADIYNLLKPKQSSTTKKSAAKPCATEAPIIPINSNKNNAALLETVSLVDIILAKEFQGAQRLLNVGENPNVLVRNITPLMAACRMDNFDVAEKLISCGATVNISILATRESPFSYAVYFSSPNLIRLLLQHGANPEQMTGGVSPLIYSVIYNNPEVVQALLVGGANPNTQDNKGFSALHHAVKDNFFNLVILLIIGRADVNLFNQDGWAPLHYAARLHDTEIMQALIAAGAEVDITRSEHGQTPLHLDANNTDNIHSIAGLKILLDNKSNINAVDNNGETAICLAVKRNAFEKVAFLLSQGANCKIQNKHGGTALFRAIFFNYLDIFNLVLNKSDVFSKHHMNKSDWAKQLNYLTPEAKQRGQAHLDRHPTEMVVTTTLQLAEIIGNAEMVAKLREQMALQIMWREAASATLGTFRRIHHLAKKVSIREELLPKHGIHIV